MTNYHATPTTPIQTGFDYKKLLGFQPLIPSKVPSGYALTNIQAEIDTGAKIGNSYSIKALYQNENREFRIWEAKSTVALTFPSFAQKATLNGISDVLYQADGYNFQFNKNGIVYRVEGGNLTYQQVGAVASSLTSLIQKIPSNIIRRTATK